MLRRMMNRLGKMRIKPEVTVALVMMVGLLIVVATRKKKTSSYELRPIPINVEAAAGSEGNLLSKPYNLECVPSSKPTAGYYTKSLTPGGVCDGQSWVVANANYKIMGGIGGSLLDVDNDKAAVEGTTAPLK